MRSTTQPRSLSMSFGVMVILQCLVSSLILPDVSLAEESFTSAEGGEFDVVGSLGGGAYPVTVEGNYAYLGIGVNLVVLDISDSNHPKFVSRVFTSSRVSAITIADDLAITGDVFGTIQFFNIADPRHPGIYPGSKSLTFGSSQINPLVLQDTTLYVGSADYGLVMLDIADLTSPVVIGRYSVGVTNMAMQGDRIYVTTNEGKLEILDQSQGPNPVKIGTVTGVQSCTCLAVSGTTLYTMGWDDTGAAYLFCIDVSSPSHPVIIGTSEGWGYQLVWREENILTSNGKFNTYDVSDPANPKKIEFDAFSSQSSNLVFDGTMCFATMDTGEMQLIDWADIHHPKAISSYSEPYYSRGLAMMDDLLFVSGWGISRGIWAIDVSTPSTPVVVSEYEFGDAPTSMTPLGNSLMLIASEYTDSQVVDMSNPSQPQLLSTLPESFMGDVVYEAPLLYGSSYKRGLQIINFEDPTHPSTVYAGDISESSTWMGGLAKKGKYAYVFSYEPEKKMVAYDVSDPASPQLAWSSSTGIRPTQIDTHGKMLYLAGFFTDNNQAEYPVFCAYNLADSFPPQLEYKSNLDQFTNSLAVSAGVAYTEFGGEGVAAYNITSGKGINRIASFRPFGSVGDYISTADILTSGPLVFLANFTDCVDIYRHTLPEPSTDVTFECAGLVYQSNQELRLKIFWDEPASTVCSTSTVIEAQPLVDCRIGCPLLAEGGTVACDETSFSPVVNCEDAASVWMDSVVNEIEEQSSGLIRVTRTDETSFTLDSIRPFYGALCGEELGLPVDQGMDRVIQNCPVNNLFDGVPGNEMDSQATGGFGIIWARPTKVPTPTPSSTPTSTVTETPTATETATWTETPTETFTQTPSPTATNSPEPSPTHTYSPEPTPTGTATQVPTIPGDITDDQKVNAVDVLDLLSAWNGDIGSASPEDINHDGGLDMEDLLILSENWHVTTGASE